MADNVTSMLMVSSHHRRELKELISVTRKPFIKMLCDVHDVSLPQYRMRKGCMAETIYPPETVRLVAQIESLMEQAVEIAISAYVHRNGWREES